MCHSGNTFQDKDCLSNESRKLIAIVKLRDQMRLYFGGGKFLPPTTIHDSATVGIMLGGQNWLAEGKDYLSAICIWAIWASSWQ